MRPTPNILDKSIQHPARLGLRLQFDEGSKQPVDMELIHQQRPNSTSETIVQARTGYSSANVVQLPYRWEHLSVRRLHLDTIVASKQYRPLDIGRFMSILVAIVIARRQGSTR